MAAGSRHVVAPVGDPRDGASFEDASSSRSVLATPASTVVMSTRAPMAAEVGPFALSGRQPGTYGSTIGLPETRTARFVLSDLRTTDHRIRTRSKEEQVERRLVLRVRDLVGAWLRVLPMGDGTDDETSSWGTDQGRPTRRPPPRPGPVAPGPATAGRPARAAAFADGGRNRLPIDRAVGQPGERLTSSASTRAPRPPRAAPIRPPKPGWCWRTASGWAAASSAGARRVTSWACPSSPTSATAVSAPPCSNGSWGRRDGEFVAGEVEDGNGLSHGAVLSAGYSRDCGYLIVLGDGRPAMVTRYLVP